MEGNKGDFLTSLRKDLERELEQLKIEKREEKEKLKNEATELVRRELAETERKNSEKLKELETKIKQVYYWLGGIIFTLLVIIIGLIFVIFKNWK